ncbi:hypothetical protein B0H15DRAFT_822516 [Mycena belliarum]|uniref:Mid2 domain-containing protein n=1 Tax=Mycena belliarum TaxID=1033014 RepID=A0AAD6XWD4_9AGAR|nr:hypothetical protein B0H15DRAFT_822516 [Mycena belliae]
MFLSLVVFSSLVFAGITTAQTTNATCSPSFQWAYNSLNQSPCLVAAFLASVCNDGQFMVPALINDLSFYTGPTVAQANACACSSVFYSLLSACADCQSGKVLTWSTFNANCSTVYPQIYKDSIPSGTAVPHWAYQNVTANNGFNITVAQMQLNAPESTANPKATSTTLPPSPIDSSSPKKSHAGAIAGGVVGGVVFIFMICMAAFWFIRRSRKGNAPSNFVQPTMAYHHTGDATPFSSAIQTPKLYNPADPSTFPSSPSSAMYNSGRVQSPSYTGNTVTDGPRTTQYSGVPEV